MKWHKIIALGIWISLLVATLLLFILRPDLLDGDQLKRYISENAGSLLMFYTAISYLRCLTLIPATPFIVAGVLLFPDRPHTVMLISTSSVMLAATLHFYFSRFLEFDVILKHKFYSKFERAQNTFKKYGILVTFLWTIAPFTPSELIYYIAGISGIKYWKFFLSVFTGVLILLSLYIYAGGELIASFF